LPDRSELQRRLANEFAAQGWPYEHEIGPILIDAVERRGPMDGKTLVRQVPADYFDRHTIARDQMVKSLDRALGGLAVEPGAGTSTSVVINDHRYSIQIGEGASVSSSQINTAGNQMTIQPQSSKDDVLATTVALVRAGLAGGWNEAAALDLSRVIDARDDIDIEDVRSAVHHAVEAEKPDKARIKQLVMSISTSALAGALSTGIVAGLGALF
jgi:hypothetical protein